MKTNLERPAIALTPQELQVALAVADGATNKEAAASLFVSAKTVEFHLGHIYRKLGLRSRTELARHMTSSLAVDVEPTVFWTGEDPSPSDELDRWKAVIGFDPARHGTVCTGNNGPSGAGLVADVLAPLGLNPATVAFTDAVPWFFAKNGLNSQGDAISNRFNPIARQLGLREGDLPTRPTTKHLVAIASSSERAAALRAEIVKSGATLVITVGQEALDAVRRVADRSDGVQTRLAPDEAYGPR